MSFDPSTILFRASSIGKLMTAPRSKSETLSETAKKHLVDVYVSAVYDRQTDISNRYIKKGLAVEEDSITLYSRVTRQFFKKNEEQLSNEYVKGTPDIYTGSSIRAADLIIDIKSSWDLYTYMRTYASEVNSDYYWQLQTYMWLTGAKSSRLVYCLVNTPEPLINDEKRRLLWQMGIATEESEIYQQACAEIDRAMTYDDIPMQHRVNEIEVQRNDSDIERIAANVLYGRSFIATLHARVAA